MDNLLLPPSEEAGHRGLGSIEEAPQDSEWILPPIGRTPAWNIAVNIIVYMAAPMSMPATFAAAGWWWGSAFLLYSASITYQTGRLIGDICIRYPKYDNYPRISSVCFESISQRQGWGGERGTRGAKFGLYLAVVMQFCTFYLDSTAQCLYVAQYWDQLFPESPFCVWQWLLLTWAMAIPVIQIPTFHESRWIALVTLIGVGLIVLTFIYEVVLVKPWNCVPGPANGASVTTSSVLLSFSAFAYAFGGHGMYPEEIREMERPEQWPSVMNWTYSIMIPMYFLCSLLGYYAYGDFSNANINLNFPSNHINTVSIIVQLVFTYYCIFCTSLVIMLQVESSCFGISPTAIWQREFCGLSSVVVRFVFRTLFVGSQVLLCEALLSGDGDTLLAMQALAGAVGMSAFTYSLPFIFHWELMGDEIGPLTKAAVRPKVKVIGR